jgi:NAD(P)H dehydrogenase (quinone)
MIVVTGVTGNLGRVVVEDLLAGVPADRIAAAFAGADVVLLVSSPNVTPGTRARQHGNAISAAKAAGVGRIVYTSAIKADSGPGFLADHAATETLLEESGLTSTVLRNTFYSDLFVNPDVVKAAVEAGEITAADGGQALNTATIQDFGLAASAVLTGSGHEGARYELRGPLWTYDELAVAISEESGTTVAHRQIPLAEAGDGAFVAQLVGDGFFAEPSDDLEKLLGRPAAGIRALVRSALA